MFAGPRSNLCIKVDFFPSLIEAPEFILDIFRSINPYSFTSSGGSLGVTTHKDCHFTRSDCLLA